MTQKIVKLSVSGNDLEIERYVDIKEFDPSNDNPPKEERFRGYGFGSFLLNIKPEEIEYDQTVLEFLKSQINCRYSSLGDLFGFEFTAHPDSYKEEFKDPSIVYGSLGKKLSVPKEDCTISDDAFNMLKEAL